jgi:hypothetical protein
MTIDRITAHWMCSRFVEAAMSSVDQLTGPTYSWRPGRNVFVVYLPIAAGTLGGLSKG